jgi:hypothetical protein
LLLLLLLLLLRLLLLRLLLLLLGALLPLLLLLLRLLLLGLLLLLLGTLLLLLLLWLLRAFLLSGLSLLVMRVLLCVDRSGDCEKQCCRSHSERSNLFHVDTFLPADQQSTGRRVRAHERYARNTSPLVVVLVVIFCKRLAY